MEAVMAKKGAGRPAKAEDAARTTIINLKGTPDYAKWLDDVHKKTHIPKAVIFRLAVQEWAERNDHDAPPES